MSKSTKRRLVRYALLVGAIWFFIWGYGIPGVPAKPEHLGIGNSVVFMEGDESWMLLDVRRYRYRSSGAFVSVKAVSSTESVWFVHFTRDSVRHVGKLPSNVHDRPWRNTLAIRLGDRFFLWNGSNWQWTGERFEVIGGLPDDAPYVKPDRVLWWPYGAPIPFAVGEVTLALELRGPKAQEVWLSRQAADGEWQHHLFSLDLQGVASKSNPP